jgi:RNA polymerase sigma factor (sigma-70 family)
MVVIKLKQVEKPNESLVEFKTIFEEHKKHVYAISLSILRDVELAEDVLQEVFIKLFQQLKHQEISNIRAWLIRVSRNTALDLYRKNQREKTGFDSQYFERMDDLAGDPAEKLVLTQYLQLLDREERQIIILKEISGMKHKEIAKIMEMPLGTVLWKYSRALKKMRKGIERKGDF